MTLRLSEEARVLRAQAEIEHRCMQDVARAAVREYVQRRCAAAQIEEALHVVIPRYGGCSCGSATRDRTTSPGAPPAGR